MIFGKRFFKTFSCWAKTPDSVQKLTVKIIKCLLNQHLCTECLHGWVWVEQEQCLGSRTWVNLTRGTWSTLLSWVWKFLQLDTHTYKLVSVLPHASLISIVSCHHAVGFTWQYWEWMYCVIVLYVGHKGCFPPFSTWEVFLSHCFVKLKVLKSCEKCIHFNHSCLLKKELGIAVWDWSSDLTVTSVFMKSHLYIVDMTQTLFF